MLRCSKGIDGSLASYSVGVPTTVATKRSVMGYS